MVGEFYLLAKGHNKRKARLMRSCGPLRRAFLFVSCIYKEAIGSAPEIVFTLELLYEWLCEALVT